MNMWIACAYCYFGFCRSKKLKPIVVDPGLYLAEESEVYYATQKRELPDAYRLFTGEDAVYCFICFM